MPLARVHRRRAATQYLTSTPARTGADVVRRLLAVQAQDAPMAAWSLGMRTAASTRFADVLAEQASGGWLRTHVLRPTWHLVAPEDLRWLQRVTGPRVEASLAARHRGLGLDARARDRAVDVLRELISGRRAPTRRELTIDLAERGLPASGEQVGHQLMVAELRGVVCSGPPRDGEHTYALVDEVVPATAQDHLPDEEARTTLVRRFMAGHGPATERDLVRWSTLNLGQVRAALHELDDVLDHVVVGEDRMWFDPTVAPRATRRPGALLVPAFDEVTLTYADHGAPRRDPSSPRPRIVNAIGGGTVLLGAEDVAAWRRTVTRDAVEVTVSPDAPLATAELDAVQTAAARLARFLERPLRFQVG
jgi:DNA glycosylase AlkZ-like